MSKRDDLSIVHTFVIHPAWWNLWLAQLLFRLRSALFIGSWASITKYWPVSYIAFSLPAAMDAVSFRSLYTIALEYMKSGCPIKKRNVQTTLLDGEIQLIPHGPSRVRCWPVKCVWNSGRRSDNFPILFFFTLKKKIKFHQFVGPSSPCGRRTF